MPRTIRLARIAAVAALGGSLAASPAFAQTNAPAPPAAPQPPAAPAAPVEGSPPPVTPQAGANGLPPLAGAAGSAGAAPAADPPARAGRIAGLDGTVSFHGPGADHWDAAQLNFPVTDGDAVWTEPQADAAVEVSASHIDLAGATELDINTLDATSMTMTAPQGEIYLKIMTLQPGETYTVATPRGMITIAGNGRFGITAGDQATPTTVSVLDGEARVQGQQLDLAVKANQTATITGDTNFTGSIGPLQMDAFLNAREHPQPVAAVVQTNAQSAPPPPAVQAMPGAADLTQYGSWQSAPQYGTVWYPQVATGWVPYRTGHWAYVAPWGWTWVDAAPWGFAPFHYGRWVRAGGRWGWAPVYAAPGFAVAVGAPVYAPALVSFVGVNVGGVGISASIGWVPLGWGEPYHPWYHASPAYFQGVNRTYVRNVTNITTINNNYTINNFANRGGATVVPGSVMTGSRPVAGAVQHLTPQQISQFHAAPNLAVRPTAQTAGVTPTVAHQYGFTPPARPNTVPGPAITHAAAAVPAPAGAVAHPPAPMLRPAGAATVGHPATVPGTAGAPAHPPGVTGTTAGTPAHPPATAGTPAGAPHPATVPGTAGSPHPVGTTGGVEHPATAGTPHPAGTTGGVEHPATAGTPHPAPTTGGVEHPAGTTAGAPHPAATTGGAPHPATAGAPHPGTEHTGSAPHPATEPHAATAPHAAGAPHPAGNGAHNGPAHPAEKPAAHPAPGKEEKKPGQ